KLAVGKGRYAEMEKKLSAAIEQLPNEKEIPDLIDSISASGEDAGLKIMLFKPGREVPKGFYAEIPVNMSVEGRFESMFSFSYRVSRLPRIVNVGNLDIVSQGHKNRIPLLKAEFVATTFRFIPGPPEGEQKK
ncbi:MAG: type 4a pilus biogenesis protein PilO, partial [Deltaproteobacteria bacterium]